LQPSQEWTRASPFNLPILRRSVNQTVLAGRLSRRDIIRLLPKGDLVAVCLLGA